MAIAPTRMNALWVTEVLVRHDWRRRGVCDGCYDTSRQPATTPFGIMCADPVTCMVAANVFGDGLASINLAYIRDNAKPIMASAPLPRIHDAVPRRTLFNRVARCELQLASGARTGRYVDQGEVMSMLANIVGRAKTGPLGIDLPPGEEFLLAFPKDALPEEAAPSIVHERAFPILAGLRDLKGETRVNAGTT
ncbi:hypothetical protein S40293_11207 [Stachybotrys chartarum IBT 40293]|nr:hypothetical protein S40293_11207 [Stachybotrys chartarum IBT 40293]